MKGFFITGTDTGIGKTALSALLLAELRRRRINAAPMKPAQTGCEGDGVPDLDYSLSMAGMTVSDEDYALMSPYRFEPACSPHLAAELAGTEIELAKIVGAARELAAEYDSLIVEGAGGILVPINRNKTMLDLMKALGLPVLLAARPGLGTINHTLLSIRALRSAGLDIAGIVFVASEADEPGFIEDDNGATIEQFGKVPILGTIPFCPHLRNPAPVYSALPLPVAAEVEKITNQLTL
ncbi:MAG: dethiobiotin synthase [Verrucomicrobia bacterium]|nr:dethiobiotin synthase [Verrucomicrobiota bacterium]